MSVIRIGTLLVVIGPNVMTTNSLGDDDASCADTRPCVVWFQHVGFAVGSVRCVSVLVLGLRLLFYVWALLFC